MSGPVYTGSNLKRPDPTTAASSFKMVVQHLSEIQVFGNRISIRTFLLILEYPHNLLKKTVDPLKSQIRI